MPTAPGVGIDLPVPSSVWRAEPFCKICRRKLMPNLEHVTWSEPTVTPSKLAISSRLLPCATKSLIFSIACGVNFTRLPLAEGLALVSVIAAPLVVAHQWGRRTGYLGRPLRSRCDRHHKTRVLRKFQRRAPEPTRSTLRTRNDPHEHITILTLLKAPGRTPQ